ncbi:MAG: hypothetical protein H6753_03100 [Candidatus Omnitrophica bacterium]|nr:hypothetical protein [Candidatus Omnitrophota bacterium]
MVFFEFALAGKAKLWCFLQRAQMIFAENTTGGVDKISKTSQKISNHDCDSITTVPYLSITDKFFEAKDFYAYNSSRLIKK